ncbi:hypothetical protein MTO96_034627 [Rhipicephalus appendiculatus]
MGERWRRPQPVQHSDGPRPRRRLFYSSGQQQPEGFDDPMGAAYLQELLGLPSTYPWTPGPTLPTEPVPYYYVQWPCPAFPLFPPWMVPAFSYGITQNQRRPWRPAASPDVARNGAPPTPPERQVVKRAGRGSQTFAEQGAEAVRFQAPRVWTRTSATPSTSETSRSSPSREEQYIELVLSRLLDAAADLGLGLPDKDEEARCSGRKFVYSAEMLRSLNVHSRASTPASRSEHRDENLEASASSASNIGESPAEMTPRARSNTPDIAAPGGRRRRSK